MSKLRSPMEQFARDIRDEVELRAGSDATPEALEDAFTEYVIELLAEHNDVGCAAIMNYKAQKTGGIPPCKINAWELSRDHATLDLFVSLYHGGDTIPVVSAKETAKYFALARGFLRRALGGVHTRMGDRSDACNVAMQIHEAHEALSTVRLFFLTDGSANVQDVRDDDDNQYNVRFVSWDIRKLAQLRVGERAAIELDFTDSPQGPLPCLRQNGGCGEYETYLAFVPGLVLAELYAEHGQRLLESNVRAFLQVKGKINKGIQQTLREAPGRFLAYNNGLCCTAAEVEVGFCDDGFLRLRKVTDFQIVNGGQTTASIFHAWKKERLDVSSVTVQVKLTVLKSREHFAEFVPLIAKYANSQNKVSAADLSANGLFHMAIEHYSREVFAFGSTGTASGTHWYYERARGSYLDDKGNQGTPARKREWEKVNPTRQKFTKTDVAKYEHAWMGLPHVVCLGAEKNFIRFAFRMDEDGEPPVDETYFKRLVAKAILWRTAEKLFDTLSVTGYRSNSVAYAVAWAASRSDYRIDLDRIWREQRVPSAVCDVLKAACKAAWDYLTSQQGNINEASKRKECWESFARQKLDIGDEWERDLADESFLPPDTAEKQLRLDWERISPPFVEDLRTFAELEAYSGLQWIAKKRNEFVRTYASLQWHELRGRPGIGLKKIATLIDLLKAAGAEELPE